MVVMVRLPVLGCGDGSLRLAAQAAPVRCTQRMFDLDKVRLHCEQLRLGHTP